MRRLFALVLILLTVGPVLAGNARTDRTAQTFRQDQARRAYQNYQWQQQYAAQQRDLKFYRDNPHNPEGSHYGRMQNRSRQYWKGWQRNTAPRPTVGYYR